MARIEIAIALGCLLLLSLSAHSQSPEWVNYTNGDRVFDIQDNGAFLWIATEGGLVRLNKNNDEVTFFNRANKNLPDNRILSLAVDSSNNIWMGTERNGVGKFDGKVCVVYNTSNSGIPFDGWNTVITCRRSEIWIGSLRFISVFNGISWKSYETGNPLTAFSAIHSIHFDKEGTPWIGATWGLGKFIGDSLLQNYGGFNKIINVIQSDTDNVIWIGTQYNGLFQYDGTYWNVFDSSNSEIASNVIHDMKFDKRGNLWIATAKGLVKFKGSDWKVYDTANSPLPKDGASSIEIDSAGIIWIGTFQSGLYKFDGEHWKHYNLSNSSLPCNNVYAVENDKKGDTWVGTYRGLNRFSDGHWILYDDRTSGLKNDFVLSLESFAGGLWIGARGYNCLTRYDGTDWVVYDSTNSILKEDMITSIAIDSGSNVWLGTWRGIVAYDGSSWKRYDINNTPMTSSFVSDVLCDYKGNLWAAMSTNEFEGQEGGLAKLNGTEWTTYSSANSGLPSDSVNCLCVDSANNIWIGTSQGLAKLDGDNWKICKTSNSGILSNSVISLFCNQKDTIWIGTPAGLSELVGEREWTNFTTANSGLSENYIATVGEDLHGNIWIGHSMGGISVFRKGGVVLSTVARGIPPRIQKNLLLCQNYPNPFNPSTKIRYDIPAEEKVTLKIYDILGREIETLVNVYQKPGEYEVEWNPVSISSGVYFYTLKAGNLHIAKKLILLR